VTVTRLKEDEFRIISVWAQRVSYVGELGWELCIQPGNAMRVWDALMEAGSESRIQPAGYKAICNLFR
jgi:4-methylaminobutanoate oxidase (formaldehyde-forming)